MQNKCSKLQCGKTCARYKPFPPHAWVTYVGPSLYVTAPKKKYQRNKCSKLRDMEKRVYIVTPPPLMHTWVTYVGPFSYVMFYIARNIWSEKNVPQKKCAYCVHEGDICRSTWMICVGPFPYVLSYVVRNIWKKMFPKKVCTLSSLSPLCTHG